MRKDNRPVPRLHAPGASGAPDPAARERAFDACFRANYAGLYRFARRLLRSAVMAEDVLQDVFLYVWERHEIIDEATPTSAYLYRAVHNAAVNRLRHQRIEHRFAEREARVAVTSAAPPEAVDQEALARAVYEAIEALPERCRLIFTLSRQEDLTYQEIAETLGLSVKTVEAQMSRAFRLLRESLEIFLSASLFLTASSSLMRL